MPARGAAQGLPEVIAADADPLPWLSVVEETSGCRVRLSTGATLMSTAIAAELCQHLPVSLRWRTGWRLVYSPRLHGVSLQTFYRRMQAEGPSLLLVQDHCGYAFGGFATAPWHVADRYFGSGECFVFRFRRRLPKPVMPLLQHSQLLAAAQRGEGQGADGEPGLAPGGLEDVKEEFVRETIRHAVKVLSDWHPKVRAEAERAERAAAAAGSVTSPTEALDEVLGKHADAVPAAVPPPTTEPCAARLAAGEAAQGLGAAGDHSAGPTASGVQLSPGVDTLADQSAVLAEGSSAADLGVAESGLEEAEEGGDLGLEAFHWSLKDPFFLFSDMECIAMGGGSSFALYLEKDLLHGMSEPCSTFGSEKLSSEGHFIISSLECWVFDDPSEVDMPQ